MTDDVRRARTAYLWVGVVVPFLLLVIAAVIALSWAPDLPDPVAIHWSGDGPNGFAPLWVDVLILVGTGVGLVALFAALAFFGHRLTSGSLPAAPVSWSGTARLLGAVSLGMAGLLAFLLLVSLGVQRGLDDAHQAPGIGNETLIAMLLLAVLAVLAVVGWFLQPAVSPRRDTGAPASALPLADSERAVWVGTAAWGTTGRVVTALSLLLGVAAVVFGLLTVQREVSWPVLIALVGAAVALFLAVSTFSLRVRIGAEGLRVRSALGWPRKTIPADEIADVRVVDVVPLGEFGGWGWRTSLDGRTGVVLRRGPAVEVAYGEGRTFVVTVDDAETAAAVLAAAAAAAREEGENA